MECLANDFMLRVYIIEDVWGGEVFEKGTLLRDAYASLPTYVTEYDA